MLFFRGIFVGNEIALFVFGSVGRVDALRVQQASQQV
jgi:hypothetical protein